MYTSLPRCTLLGIATQKLFLFWPWLHDKSEDGNVFPVRHLPSTLGACTSHQSRGVCVMRPCAGCEDLYNERGCIFVVATPPPPLNTQGKLLAMQKASVPQGLSLQIPAPGMLSAVGCTLVLCCCVCFFVRPPAPFLLICFFLS